MTVCRKQWKQFTAYKL